jgi:hypothetical protein
LFVCRWTGKAASADAHGNVIKFATFGSRTTAYVQKLQPKNRSSGKPQQAPKTPAAKRKHQQKQNGTDDCAGSAETSRGGGDVAEAKRAKKASAMIKSVNKAGTKNGVRECEVKSTTVNNVSRKAIASNSAAVRRPVRACTLKR